MMKNQIVMRRLESSRGRQNDVRMAGGFVDVNVYRHKKLEVFECTLELLTVRRGQHRIARICDERLDLPLSWGQHFGCHRRHRIFAVKFW